MFGLTRKSFSASTQPSRFKPQLEALEERRLMSIAAVSTAHTFADVYAHPEPTAAGIALIQSLPSTPVRETALADYQRDGTITRNDMIDIFYSATNGFSYLLPDALESVQTLVDNAQTVAMPDYVHYLAAKVTSDVSGLGQAPAQLINDHVNNYFLGLARPDPGLYPTYTNPSRWVPGTYQLVHAPLWNRTQGPSYRDVTYTYSGDSNLIYTLREVAYRRPTDIRQMFIDNGDGTFTVRLYNGTTHAPQWVTVDSYLPYKASNIVDASGNSVGQVPATGARPQPYLWVALAEKAYAQANGLSYPALAHVSQASAWLTFTGLAIRTSTSINPTTIAARWSQGSFVILNGNNTVVETTDNGPHHIFRFSGDFIIFGVPTSAANWFSVRRVEDDGYVVELPPSQLAKYFKSWYDVSAVSSAARNWARSHLNAMTAVAAQYHSHQAGSLSVVGRDQ